MTRLLLSTCAIVVLAALVAAAEPNSSEKKFKKLLYDSIGHQWYARMEAHQRELKVGTTRVHLGLSRDGTIRDLRVLSNTSNDRVGRLVLDAIRHAKLPAVPPEILKGNTFEDEMTFTVYPD